MKKLILAVMIALGACTSVSYEDPNGVKINYSYIWQSKDLEVEKSADSTHVRATTSSDTAVINRLVDKIPNAPGVQP